MVSENKDFDQLFKCSKALRLFSTSDEATPISTSLECGTEIAHVEEDSLHVFLPDFIFFYSFFQTCL